MRSGKNEAKTTTIRTKEYSKPLVLCSVDLLVSKKMIRVACSGSMPADEVELMRSCTRPRFEMVYRVYAKVPALALSRNHSR